MWVSLKVRHLILIENSIGSNPILTIAYPIRVSTKLKNIVLIEDINNRQYGRVVKAIILKIMM